MTSEIPLFYRRGYTARKRSHPGPALGPERSYEFQDEGGGGEADQGDLGDDALIRQASTCTEPGASQRRKKERLDKNWKDAAVWMKQDMLCMGPQEAKWQAERVESMQRAMQARINESWRHHTLKSQESNLVHPKVERTSEATFVGVGCMFSISVPTWKCYSLVEDLPDVHKVNLFTAEPMHCGCFGSTPIRPRL
ncbi:hypothetical protein DUNSADRAFT_1848 [Dunaliella salina]|uniref:Encoded protein n=1 Tax=Dunaliella salina TaxID=3046 RepID=A0ABQ7GWJ0_DUNSA|nr:hypothetical protein DUNSADRAFT_1848 [Dunaliella salina]|eukprot:KAF5838981.1 hypothetical protein DUNSADRAFT_1848 [Dunaliella salina]